jgi:hypothetical protein
MTSFRRTALALALATLPSLGFASAPAPAASPAPQAMAPAAEPAKQALVAELMRTTGAIEIGNQIAGQMAQSFRQQVPAEMHPIVDEIFGNLDMREMEDEIAALYARTFTEQELKDILAFYATPSGRSMLAKTPALMQESVAIGQAWGARKAEAVIARIKAEQDAKRDAEAAKADDAKG